MKKILFLAFDDFSSINGHLLMHLRKHFSNHEIDLVEIKEILKKNYLVLALAVVAVFTEYFFDFASGHKKWRAWRKHLYQTPFIARYFNRVVSQLLAKDNFSFVFQTQSLFDSGSSRMPNFIYTDHTNLNNLNYPHINPREYLGTEKYIQLERQVYNNATMLMVMSANMRDSLVTQYGVNPAKIKLVYAGSNTKISDAVDRNKYANKNILFVGKEWERKGGPLLVEAFAEVLKSIPNATLTILGCKPEVTVPNCNVVGDVSLEDVAAYYKKASLFCLPTKREPFGIVFIEAMLNRLAIVTNDMGATPELVRNNENGFLLNHDASEYAKTLVKLLSDPVLCEQFGERSYQMAIKTYTWDNVGSIISNAIKTIEPK